MRNPVRTPLHHAFGIDAEDAAVVVFDNGFVAPPSTSSAAAIATHRGRASGTEAPSAGTASLLLVDGYPSALAAGMPVYVKLSDALLGVIYPGDAAAQAAARYRFVGRVSDVGDYAATATGRVDVPIAASTLLGRLLGAAFPYDVDLADPATGDPYTWHGQLWALADAAWWGDPALRVSSWAQNDAAWENPADGPGTRVDWDAQGVDVGFARAGAAAGTRFGDVWAKYEAAGLVYVDRRDGTFDYLVPVTRSERKADPAWGVTLQADEIVAPFVVGQHVDTLANDVTVTDYAATPHRVVDDLAARMFGGYAASYDTTALDAATAADKAAEAVGRYGRPHWTPAQVVVDLLDLWRRGRQDVVRALLRLDPESPVQLVGLPASVPSSADGGWFWAVGIDEQLDADRWTLTLSLVRNAVLDNALAWSELPADLTWSTIDYRTSWFGLSYYPEG